MVRFKNRWLLVEFIPSAQIVPSREPEPLTSRQIYSALKESVVSNFGDTGWGAVGFSLTVKYYSPMTNICIIRVGRDQHRIAWGAVTLLDAIEGRKVIPNVVHISGTIKHTQLAAIEHNRVVVARYRASVKQAAASQDSYEQFLNTSTREIEALQD
ncbi:hypothetical protein JAAARDRAFT_68592 [Jaapia argillacea MUCL 33604]|uniref:Ribonuclease P/MRP protein subunit POP5 n=1 Tax=Jaapia argillacea MUCL 33604 TaxID=933084 RepID=A0A067Q8V4_9AGAM|nr:hypothetical protein JAAARDRAFT_68592 [Jaapia argillacea MUCL 33604]